MIVTDARPTGKAGVGDAAQTPDPRAQAFAEFLESVNRRDWRAGQLATRRLRALGLAVCLVTPPGDRRGA